MKSWEVGDMEQTLTPVFRVSELNEYVSLVLSNDPNLCDLRVSGEISGCPAASSQRTKREQGSGAAAKSSVVPAA